MAYVEIERKWLARGFPELPAQSEERQEQAYLAFGQVTLRIRKVTPCGPGEKAGEGPMDESYCLTVKGREGRGGLSRAEVELPLSAEQYGALLPLAAAPAATKRLRRYALPGGLTLECSLVDEGEPGAFYYAEVEFSSEEEAAAFVPPPGLGREVTAERGCSMAAHCLRKRQGG